jgi:hypothetical protein
MVALAALAGASALAAACGEARPVEDSRPRACPDWVDSVGAALQQRCTACHGGERPAAGWDATTYLGAVSIAPERFVAAVAPEDATHRGLFTARADDLKARDDLRRWALECSRRRARSSVHSNGVLDPFSADFHGAEVRRQGFELSSCAGCHGADFSGGTAKASCRDCHRDGPTACTGCHGQPPSTGAHRAHVAGALTGGRGLSCGECHAVPLVYTDAGHLLDERGVAKTRAVITFGPFAATTPRPAERPRTTPIRRRAPTSTATAAPSPTGAQRGRGRRGAAARRSRSAGAATACRRRITTPRGPSARPATRDRRPEGARATSTGWSASATRAAPAPRATPIRPARTRATRSRGAASRAP